MYNHWSLVGNKTFVAFGQQWDFLIIRKPVKVRRKRPNLSCHRAESQNSHRPFILMDIAHFTAIFLYSGNIAKLLLFISGIKSLEIAVTIIYTTHRNLIVFIINSLKYLYAFFGLGLWHILHSTHKSWGIQKDSESYVIRNMVIYLLLYNVQLLINNLLSLSLFSVPAAYCHKPTVFLFRNLYIHCFDIICGVILNIYEHFPAVMLWGK